MKVQNQKEETQKKVSTYPFQNIESKWQKHWEKKGYFEIPITKETQKTNKIKETKKKFYCLEMWPYPSGRIHMGHVRNYSIGDVIAITKRLLGYEVLHPMGWDAFGLPAENAALEKKIHPAQWTFENISAMKQQLMQLGFSYDWNRELTTCNPDYYQWQQLIFLRLYEKGLVYKKNAKVNWCTGCKTVLANEQVEADECWRCGNEVIQKKMAQWFFRITQYSEELLEKIKTLKAWPRRVRVMQENWIGRSKGILLNFVFEDKPFPVFTTRPDTIYGVTFMALSIEHPLTKQILSDPKENLRERVQAMKERRDSEQKKSRSIIEDDKEKEGIFTGRYVDNPINGEKIPLYIADYVLGEYGTGALMGVPAHDQRDFLFAKKYQIPIRLVIQNPEKTLSNSLESSYTGEGFLVNSGEFNGLTSELAIQGIIEHAEKHGFGQAQVNYRLKDWLISRQRYWGCPIPMIDCEKCGTIPVPEKDLPVVLPLELEFQEVGNPLEKSHEFQNVLCPKCSKEARRETDTMDTFVCSSWYFIRFCSPKELLSPFNKEQANHWMNVDQYTGGIEHAILHLLYSRFFVKALRDLDWIDADEPFKRLLTQGMVVNQSYFSKSLKQYYSLQELGENRVTCPKTGEALIVRTEKMSKSKNNGVDPQDMIQKYGADTVRLFLLFASPPEQDLEWNEEGVEGCSRFLKRVYRLALLYQESPYTKEIEIEWDRKETQQKTHSIIEKMIEKIIEHNSPKKELLKKIHKTIRKVENDFIQRYHFNTGIAAMMELVNALYLFPLEAEEDSILLKLALEVLSRLLFPVAPHIAEEVHSMLGFTESIYEKPWIQYDPKLTEDEIVTYVFQVNGKVRGKKELPASLNQEELLQKALEHKNIQNWIQNKQLIQHIIVPKKLVNLVVKNPKPL